MTKLEAFIQAFILVTTLAYTILGSGKTPRQRRWGFYVCVANQPAYMVTTWQHGQWGLFVLCWFFLALSWRGIRNNPDVRPPQP